MGHTLPPVRPEQDGAAPNPAASMLLLQNIEQFALDPGYAEYATKKPVHRSILKRAIIGLLIAILGFLITVAALNLRAESSDETDPRLLLAEQVHAGQESVQLLVSENQDLAEQVRQQGELEGVVSEISPTVTLSAASTKVTGPGVTVTIVEEGTSLSGKASSFRDTDLRAVTNLLWAAGAEAIAVNGQRLGAETSIRTGGSLILVNLIPVTSPYVIEAIGDPVGIMNSLQSGPGLGQIEDIRRATGATIREDRAENLVLGGLPLPTSESQPIS
ncbi:DUF881 domain-containing protein [Actinomyces minihominis]|uniref:DUF881 domain-containing protein n=1 Tax=Actinomyces minihominis TaxID=2002838 RepID=UPI000C079686|nr:DUF881 domain-containing protein [Actinomyces minihominis]